MKKAESTEMLDSGKIVFFPDYNAAVLSYNGEEEINIKLYQSQKELYSWGMLAGYINVLEEKKSEILYAGQLKHFDELNYHGEKVDEKKVDLDKDKMYKAIRQLGGHMESHILVSRYYVPKKVFEKIPFKQAEELVKNKKAKLNNYQNEKDFFLSYGDNLYFRSDNQGAYLH
ncbi:MAG: hypothetical protein Q8O84_05655 [Nanoarchaeota archaeon]|nr:hypothetical protein [Nanoarchaeota archaeon]